MKNLTNEMYRANPALREQIEEEARTLRLEAIDQFIVQPVVRAWKASRNNVRAVFASRVTKSA